MKLREKISKDYMTAFKEKDIVAKNLLSVIKGDIQTTEKNIGSELSDEDVMKILQKSAKSLKEMVSSGSDLAKSELDIIESYLPKQMSREEIAQKVNELVELGANNIGDVMKGFTRLPVDKKIVSDIVRNIFPK